jgi:uncharacterized protein
MKALVEHLAKALVDNPDEVSVAEKTGETGDVLELRVAAGDMGRLMGRQGRTVRSIRTILDAASRKANKKYTLEIVE